MAASTDDVATLEAEVAAARERLARTIDTLADPRTHEAMKAEVMERIEGYKQQLFDGARNTAQGTANGVLADLKQRALNSPAAVAMIGAGLAYRLYRHPPIGTLLVGAGTALLMRARGVRTADASAYRAPYDRDRPRGYVPGGVAGYGYPVAEDAPGSTTTERMMATASEAASSLAEQARHTGQRVSDTVARARDAAYETGARLSDAAVQAGNAAYDAARRAGASVQEAGERARAAAYDMMDRTRSTAQDGYARASAGVSGTAERARAGTASAFDAVAHNPALLGAIGIAAGAAAAQALRGTERGERIFARTSDAVARSADIVGRSAREVGSRAREAAGWVAESASNVASSATTAAAGLAETVASRMPEFGSEDEPRMREHRRRAHVQHRGQGRGQGQRGGRREPDLAQHFANQVSEIATNYPLLLGALGLALGAAAGLSLRPTASEDELMGPLSDAVKAQARDAVQGRYEDVLGAADDFAEAFAAGGRRSAGDGADQAADWETVIGGGAPARTGAVPSGPRT